MSSALDDFSGEPLTELENKKLRKLIQSAEFNARTTSLVLLWGGYIGGIMAALYAARDKIAAVLKALTS